MRGWVLTNPWFKPLGHRRPTLACWFFFITDKVSSCIDTFMVIWPLPAFTDEGKLTHTRVSEYWHVWIEPPSLRDSWKTSLHKSADNQALKTQAMKGWVVKDLYFGHGCPNPCMQKILMRSQQAKNALQITMLSWICSLLIEHILNTLKLPYDPDCRIYWQSNKSYKRLKKCGDPLY